MAKYVANYVSVICSLKNIFIQGFDVNNNLIIVTVY